MPYGPYKTIILLLYITTSTLPMSGGFFPFPNASATAHREKPVREVNSSTLACPREHHVGNHCHVLKTASAGLVAQ